MIRRPPRSTRTDTLFPYTTLFRSGNFLPVVQKADPMKNNIKALRQTRGITQAELALRTGVGIPQVSKWENGRVDIPASRLTEIANVLGRSEERRVGKECVRTCSSRWSPDH